MEEHILSLSENKVLSKMSDLRKIMLQRNGKNYTIRMLIICTLYLIYSASLLFVSISLCTVNLIM
jgi:hypothetical protein